MAERSAVIDIGSNTVRLVVYNGPARAPIVLLNEKVTPRLGKDVARDGLISDKSSEAALAALARYAAMLRLMDVEDLQTVATAAVRDAKNGGEFLEAVKALGLSPRLLSGEEEAQTSAMGVISAFPGAKGVTGDLGGGSLELTRISNGKCKSGITLPFGTLRLPDLREQGHEKFSRHVRQTLKAEGWKYGKDQPFFIVGGSWRALALYAMSVLGWPIDDPHGFELAPSDALRICQALGDGEIDDDVPRISSSRRATLPDAAALLGVLTEEMQPSRIVFSSWGLREGLLYQQLDKATREIDPMLAGVIDFAETCGVSADTALHVSNWISEAVPSFEGADEEHGGKLRTAASLLALSAMRSEPNMRTEQAMGWALRKRWIGLDARGKAMLATAVLANSGQTSVPDEFEGLASEEDFRTAIGWGLAIRLCRRLTGCSEQGLAETAITRDGSKLVLTLAADWEDLFNNGAARDLRNLADWLELDAKLSVGASEGFPA